MFFFFQTIWKQKSLNKFKQILKFKISSDYLCHKNNNDLEL